jgi:hypothetical protein
MTVNTAGTGCLLYSHAVDSNKLAAQGQFLDKLLAGGSMQ